MSESINPILRKIDALLAERGMSRAGASRLANLSVDYLRKLDESAERRPHMAKIEALARVLGVNPMELMTLDADAGASRRVGAPGASQPRGERMTRDVPVLGTAAGAVVGAFALSPDVIDYVRRPPALAGAMDAYCLYVEGDSMAPRFNPGDLVFVHPHRPLLRGDTVIVQVRERGQDAPAAYIKTLAARTPEQVVVEQLNPTATIRFRREDVVGMHKVLTTRELFGV